MILHRMSSQEQFHNWLSELPKQIEQLQNMLLNDTGQELDFSPASLEILEQWLLSKYPNLNFIIEVDEYFIIEAAGGYVGETIRKLVGGEWTIELKDQEYAYLGIPGIKWIKSDRKIAPVYPTPWVTTSLSRRTGIFIYTVFEKLENRVSG